MKKKVSILLLIILVVVLAFGLKLWADNSLIAGNEYSGPTLDPAFELAFAFSDALRFHYPTAYDMIDPNLKPRLDEWMDTHQIKECEHPDDVTQISTGTNQGKKITFGCYGYNGWLTFEVDDIVIKDLKVIDWGEVREGD
jgi:hypothetical protein